MYRSSRDSSITENSRQTKGKNVEEFIKDTCKFYRGCDEITEFAFDKYVRWCNDRNLEYSCFNTFARAFRYLIIHKNMIPGIGVFPVNYKHYKEGIGYITKSGWSYSNLSINY